MSLIQKLGIFAATTIFTILNLAAPLQVHAATVNPTPTAKISFTFDDGYVSALNQAAPTLSKYGLSGTSYVITGCVGMQAPNTCQADKDKDYMNWNQIAQLKNTYGWEIGSHTVTHPYLATSDPTDQPKPIPFSQVTQELVNSKAALASHGIDATDFATPYGDYNTPVLAEIAKYYATQRGFWDLGSNTWPNSDYFLHVKQVQAGVTVSNVKTAIDQAINNKTWLILVMHDIKVNASGNKSDYEYKTSNLDQIAAYVKQKQDANKIKAVHVKNGPVTSDTNLMPNATFDNGISGGWTTDNAAQVTPNSSNNGSYPSPTNSIRFVSGSSATHLFSPKVSIDPNANYMFKNYLHVKALSSGEVGFYIDEYDANGNWLNTQFKKAENSVFAEELNFSYKASSSGVRQARMQVAVSGNSGITAFLDNVQLFPLSAVAPPPAQTNLVANGTFDAGISNGWRTDGVNNIVADSNNNGSPDNPINSIKMSAVSNDTHLFSPLVAVDSTKSYTLTSWLGLKQRTSGEIGFYIDEYDANGNWISGQFKSSQTVLGSRDVGLSYIPSSSNVKQASLQIIVTANSGILAYFDNVRWY